MLNIFGFLFFKIIDGITLFLPQEIIMSTGSFSFKYILSFKIASEIGVSFGGINFQGKLNLIIL